MKKIRFAILGPGNISHRVIKGMHKVEEVEVYAVSSRNLSRARKFADQYQIDHVYGSYEECLQDTNVDAVYIATPTHTHFDLVMLSLRYNKHVICEKPFMVHSEQVRTAFAYAKAHHLMLMEAYKTNFLPVSQQVKKWMISGKIGDVKYMEGSYCYKLDIEDKTHWAYQKEYGGGGLYDVGIYPLGYLNYLANAPVIDHKAMSIMNECGVDDFTQVLLQYENGIVASIRGGIGFPTKNIAYIYGTLGHIEVADFWKCEKAYLHIGDQIECFEEKHDKSEFRYEIQSFVHDILTNKIEDEIMSEEASFQNLKIMETSVGLK